MRQRWLSNSELQSFSSWLGDIRSKMQGTIANDILCSVCANFSSKEGIGRVFFEPFDLGTMTEVKTRTDRCPLCRIAFHIVSQALASSQAKASWPKRDHRITLRDTVEAPSVYYSDKRVGRIASYSRTRSHDWESKRLLPWLSRLFDIKTSGYHYYSTLPNISPPQGIDLSFSCEVH